MKMLWRLPSPDDRSVGDYDGDDFPLLEGSFPAEQLRRSPRLVPPRGCGVSSCKLAYDFFQGKSLHIAEDGHRRATKGPTRQGGTPK